MGNWNKVTDISLYLSKLTTRLETSAVLYFRIFAYFKFIRRFFFDFVHVLVNIVKVFAYKIPVNVHDRLYNWIKIKWKTSLETSIQHWFYKKKIVLISFHSDSITFSICCAVVDIYTYLISKTTAQMASQNFISMYVTMIDL